MISVLFLIVIVLLAGAGFVLRQRGLAFASYGSLSVFVLLTSASLSALYVPTLFDAAADAVLQQVGVPDQIQGLDAALPVDQLAGVVDLLRDPADLVQRVLPGGLGGLLGNRGDGGEPEPLLPPPSDTGYFETNVYPVFVGLTSLVLRGVALLVSLGAMVVAMSISVATTAVAKQRRAATSLLELEARVAQLEAAYNAIAGNFHTGSEPLEPR